MNRGAWKAAVPGVAEGRTRLTEWLHFHFSLSCIGEGNGNPLQCSCLENLRDGGAWWAAVYGVAQNWTRLKRFSSSSSSSSRTLHGLKCVCSYPVTPWTVASRAPPSMWFSRQEYWSGLPFPPPQDTPHPGDRTLVSCIAGFENMWNPKLWYKVLVGFLNFLTQPFDFWVIILC